MIETQWAQKRIKAMGLEWSNKSFPINKHGKKESKLWATICTQGWITANCVDTLKNSVFKNKILKSKKKIALGYDAVLEASL